MLIAVLGVVVGLATFALVARLVAREGTMTSANRVALLRARWQVEGCLAYARSEIGAVLHAAEAQNADADRVWDRLDTTLPAGNLDASCHLSLRPAGGALNVAAADAPVLRVLFGAAGMPASQADSLADAIADWQDDDDEPRLLGAEVDWYVAVGRRPPRNHPVADVRELAHVRGFEITPVAAESLVTVERGRLALNHAPIAALATLPGLGAEALARISERRQRRAPLPALDALAAELSPEGRALLTEHYAELVRTLTASPEAWILVAQSGTPGSPVVATVELRLVRAGWRAAVVRRRIVN